MDLQLYLFMSSISLIVFYLFYFVFLKGETFFLWNRLYLLSALFFSTGIPLLQLSAVVELHKVDLVLFTMSAIGAEKLAIITGEKLSWLSIIYWTGVIFTGMLFIIKAYGIRRQLRSQKKGSAYSFWKTKMIDQNFANFVAIDAHENLHIKQLHTLDIIIVEILTVFFWFNPLIYRYRGSLKLIHEYLADDYAAGFAESKKQYAMALFLQNFKAGPALANSFYTPSLLQARINMLQCQKSAAYRIWKYTLYMPLIALMLLFWAFGASVFNSSGTDKIGYAATFPGGFEAFSKYLKDNIRNVAHRSGTVQVSFIVETDGKISNEKLESSLNSASDQEALRIIKSSPKWIPAMQNNIKVRSAYRIGINFITDNQQSNGK